VERDDRLVDARARLLRAAVGFCLVPPTEPELRLLHHWLGLIRLVLSDVPLIAPADAP
jgi:hypothetical protein